MAASRHTAATLIPAITPGRSIVAWLDAAAAAVVAVVAVVCVVGVVGVDGVFVYGV